MQKGQAQVLILAGIVLIVALVGGAYYFGKVSVPKPQTPTPVAIQTPKPTSTPDETANWKTYTNTKYGYSFKYPNDWFIFHDGQYGIGEDVTALTNFDLKEYIKSGRVRIDIQVRQLDTSFDQFLGSLPEANVTRSSTEIIVDGVVGIRRVFEGEGTNIIVYLPKNGKVYSLTTSFSEPSSTILTNILSTFKFTN